MSQPHNRVDPARLLARTLGSGVYSIGRWLVGRLKIFAFILSAVLRS